MTEPRRQVIGVERERGLIVSNRLLQVLSGACGVLRAMPPDERCRGIWLDPGGYEGSSGWSWFELRGRELVGFERERHGVQAREVDERLDVRGVGLELALEVGDQPIDWHLPGLHVHVNGRQVGRGGQKSERSGEQRRGGSLRHLMLSSAYESVS